MTVPVRTNTNGRCLPRRVAVSLCALLWTASLARAGPTPAIAIAEFKVIGKVGTQEAGQAVAELLSTRVDRRRHRLVERTALKAILDEHDLTIAGIVANPSLLKNQKLRGVRHVLVGSIVRFGGLTLVARLIDVRTGDVVQAAELQASDIHDLRGELDVLAARLGLAPKPTHSCPTAMPLPAARRVPAHRQGAHYGTTSYRRSTPDGSVRTTRRREVVSDHKPARRLPFNRYDRDTMAYAEVAARHLAARLNRSQPAKKNIALLARAQDMQNSTVTAVPDGKPSAGPSAATPDAQTRRDTERRPIRRTPASWVPPPLDLPRGPTGLPRIPRGAVQ